MRATLHIIAGLLVLSPLAAGAASQDLTVINRTGYQIDSIYVSEVGRREWGNDVMGRDKLEAGERVDILFERDTRACHWSIMVKYHDDTRAIWDDLNICEISRIALFWNARSQVTVARAE